MEHRKLGKSELELPVITMGAWAIGGLFWGGSEDREAIAAIQASIDNGVDAIDTAPVYGCGHSEELVGQAIRGRRDKVKILTKCGIRWDSTEGEFHFRIKAPGGGEVTAYRNAKADSILYECEQSLRRLHIDCIDLYQIHTPSGNATPEETMGAMEKLQIQGKIRHIGVSNYSSAQLAAALRQAPVVSDQIRYNLLQRDIEQDALPYCISENVGVIAYSPMAMGLLTGKVTMDRKFPDTDIRGDRPWFAPANRKRVLDALEKVRPIADRHEASLANLAVAWVIAQPGITTALVGARNSRQATENAAASKINLTPEEVSTIRQTFEALGKPV